MIHTDPKLAAASAAVSFPAPMMEAMKRAWVANTMANSMAPAAVADANSSSNNSSSSSYHRCVLPLVLQAHSNAYTCTHT